MTLAIPNYIEYLGFSFLLVVVDFLGLSMEFKKSDRDVNKDLKNSYF